MADRFGLSTDTIDKICAVLARYPAVREAMIYGSRAKGNYKTGSDIDLTLIGGTDLILKVQLKISNDLDDLLLPYTIDLSIFNQIDDPDVIEHINRVGKLFYKQ